MWVMTMELNFITSLLGLQFDLWWFSITSEQCVGRNGKVNVKFVVGTEVWNNVNNPDIKLHERLSLEAT